MSSNPECISKCVVVSAVNFSGGGGLKILIDSLETAAKCFTADWNIIALVHDKKLVNISRVHCIEFPDSKTSWWKRIYLEWFYFKILSNKLKPDLWLSLHDITPRVVSRRQAVYCHNASPFYKLSLKESYLDPIFFLFNKFYVYLYGINIYRNYAVIVQQEWLRKRFLKRYNHSNIVVAHPVMDDLCNTSIDINLRQADKKIFFYPSLPRVFKNFEVLFQAAASLPYNIQCQIEIRFTFDGSESRYARNMISHFGNQPIFQFIGRQNRNQMSRNYAECNVVLFPSKLESWGLPITEAKEWGKPLLVADIDYAYEAVGDYKYVSFLPPDDPSTWAQAIGDVVKQKHNFSGHAGSTPPEPYVRDWVELWQFLNKNL